VGGAAADASQRGAGEEELTTSGAKDENDDDAEGSSVPLALLLDESLLPLLSPPLSPLSLSLPLLLSLSLSHHAAFSTVEVAAAARFATGAKGAVTQTR